MAGTWVESEFEALFREQFERLVRITRRVLHSDVEAEEVCSDNPKCLLSGYGLAPPPEGGGAGFPTVTARPW